MRSKAWPKKSMQRRMMKLLFSFCLILLLSTFASAKKPIDPDDAKRQQFAAVYELGLVRAGQLHGVLTENAHVVVGGNKHDGPVLCLEMNNGYQTVGRTWLLNYYEQNVVTGKEGLKALGFRRVRVIYVTHPDPTLPSRVESFDFRLD